MASPFGTQAGALFGLDARLALGIFAAISIVAGYFAWWRIEAAQDTRLYKELHDIEAALNAYQTDLGTFFLFTINQDADDADSSEDIQALWNTEHVKPGFRTNWHGPYLNRHSRQLPGYGAMSVLYATGDRKSTCTTDSDCYVWLVLEDVPTVQWTAINAEIDEGGGRYHEPRGTDIAAGLVQADGYSDPRMLFYRTVARPQ